MITRIILFGYLAVGLAFLISCGDDDDDDNNDQTNCLEVGNDIVTETIEVSEFNGISFAAVGNLFITQGEPQEMTVTTHPELVDLIDAAVIDNTLEIGLDGCIEGNLAQFDVFVTTPDLELITLAGVANIMTENDLQVDSLSIILSGVGNITLSGSTGPLNIQSLGVGNINAFNFTSDICRIMLSGAGNVEITVLSELDATISGSGNVSYKGSPAVNAAILGGGNVIDAN